MDFRVGFGYDVHRLAEGRPLMIGGVHIPHHSGSLGHSDGDVLIHAICDALLGAANLRDIGFHFSDQEAAYKDIDSRLLLEYVVAMLADNGFAIGNIDATVALQKPRLSEFIPQMQKTLAAAANISADRISIKASTTEQMGFEGREEGLSAYVVALVFKK
ncbi:MAG: 2-C-methyl-D-erythritol 2,4-cyclodiphosphate synthase [Bacteroidales bacterium]|jgi:2-C-methyl-D-erythritol 2,4-cyclodiphosphate synthase|nr:2-C-methyl-D-erythritol 2,4-cyclodiphosphate synthase [Bacteroidales bacterium]NCU34737.1 2-C-methyl-D-erythritol 2,4-cyclodiphosphate synthase [Candidatus Falkowbacteria bacterium]MDD2632226.1 2-C-methyl-D-erythritol 2,4-cyclodiphosphate synthase [Bacteroidales bacterium]MDD3525903.1 2-C-methyl-D-erythritol 2,4-cyclodiphosphate synthase [Bacteroidales bacterium]MDD4176130.1 2-C-methyl-D-erythritol 2,4-cyclodiphosphate synthase [Bacteroidales bacterium]